MTRPFDPKRRAAGALPERDRPSTSSVSRSEEDDARASSKYRAALEALFAKKSEPQAAPPPPERSSVKMIKVAKREDPRAAEREKRLGKLLAAEGRAAITKAADDLVAAGFDLPATQDVLLKLLDHAGDDRVRDALDAIARLLDAEPPQRRALLDARLRRLEDDADDADVRARAASLRRKMTRR